MCCLLSIRGRVRAVVAAVIMVLAICHGVNPAAACGGFFCQLVPINQAAEQIIFRQDGDQITAVVLIQYVGEARDFSWVVPVPGIPQLSTGSDALFQSLELATRPQFTLEREGEACPGGENASLGGLGFDNFNGSPQPPADGGVTVLDRRAVGPFDVQVVSSDDPQALATWLEDNNYDVSERGAELIGPYVEEGMNFVAVRLQQDRGTGDIRPLIMKYTSDHPCVPIRLTAVAAEQDMGILVWSLGSGRAIPLNYLHVIPNYTLLNWYQGTAAAYATYQGLITAAMNEAGGQGFATDLAGPLGSLREQLPNPADYSAELQRLEQITEDRRFYDELIFSAVFPSDQVQEILRRQVPLPEGVDASVYLTGGDALAQAAGEAALAAARPAIGDEIRADVIDPLAENLAVFDGNPYLTRLYTTLSPAEMTLDPLFSFKPDFEDQALERKAKLVVTCSLLAGTSWYLELGSGTGRAGQRVLEGTGGPPFAAPVVPQPNIVVAEFLREAAAADVQIDNTDQLGVVQVEGDGGGGLGGVCGAGIGNCGGVSMLLMAAGFAGLQCLRRRVRKH